MALDKDKAAKNSGFPQRRWLFSVVDDLDSEYILNEMGGVDDVKEWIGDARSAEVECKRRADLYQGEWSLAMYRSIPKIQTKKAFGKRSGGRRLERRAPRSVCDALWSECIKLRAGYKSELSGKPGRQIGGDAVLNAHHIIGKPTLRLRYDLANGICLTNGEHSFGIHNAGQAEKYRAKIIATIGQARWDYLNSVQRIPSKTDMALIEVALRAELKKLS